MITRRVNLCCIWFLPLLVALVAEHLAAAQEAAPSVPLDYDSAMVPDLPMQPVNRTLPRTVQLLGEAIAQKSPCIRTELVRDLGACKRPDAAAFLKTALSDPEPMVRAQAARSIGLIGSAELAPLLRPALKDPDATVRREGVLAAAALGDEQAAVAGLNDPDPVVIVAAISSLTSAPHAASAAALLEKLPPNLRVVAISDLARLRFDKTADAVAGLLNKGLAEKCAAIRALGTFEATQHAPQVISLLRDPHPTVRRYAVLTLSGLTPVSQRQDLVIAMLDDADLAVRQAAARVLAASPTPRAVAALTAQLSEPYRPLREAARAALIAAGPSAVPDAAALLDHADPRLREDGSYILGQLRSNAAVQRHIALVTDADWAVVAQAAQSLGSIGAAQAGPALGTLVNRVPSLTQEVPFKQRPLAYEAASQAIIAAAKLGYKPELTAVEPLIAQRRSYPPSVRAASLYALGLLGDVSDADRADDILAVYDDNDEVPLVRFEALKALGHLRSKPAAARLRQILTIESDLKLRWIAHWAYDRISGTVSPFVAPVSFFSAENDVSIAPFNGQDETPTFSAGLQMGQYYPPSRWVPVRLDMLNPRPRAIDGYVSLPIADDAAGVTIRVPLSVPARSRVTATAYAYFPDLASKTSAARLAVAEWFESGGKRLTRGEVLGRSTSTIQSSAEVASRSADSLLLLLGELPPVGYEDGSAAYDATALGRVLSQAAGFNIQAAHLDTVAAPQHRAGYDAARYVHIPSTELEKMDLAQRRALLDHVQSGGALIVTVPDAPDADPGRTWLASWFPVQVIGHREMEQFNLVDGYGTITLPHAVTICEAVERVPSNGEIMLHDRYLVHAAVSYLGLGRIVFISFPMNSLDSTDERTARIWRRLLDLDRAGGDWRFSTLGNHQAEFVQRMIGSPTPRLAVPATITGAYLVILLVVHGTVGPMRRPLAFAALAIGAVTAFLLLVVLGPVRHVQKQRAGARLVTIDLGPEGGGLQQEVAAYIGEGNSAFVLRSSRESVWMRPAVTEDIQPPTISMLPFVVPHAEIYSATIKTLWQANDVLGANYRVTAEAAFGPAGLELRINNRMPATIRSPVLLWGDAHPLPEIPIGRAIARPKERTRLDDYIPGDIDASDEAKLRGRVLAAAMDESQTIPRRTQESRPVIAGWLDDATVPRLFVASSVSAIRTEALLRCPVTLKASPPGSNVLIDGAFTQVASGPNSVAPYDSAKREWLTTSQNGQWLVGFRPPPQVGTIRPWHATLRAIVSAPAQTITLLRGQCRGGKITENASGSVVARWTHPISPRAADFDCQSDDFDGDGCIWLLLKVEPTTAAESQLLSPWHFDRLELSYQGQIVAAAQTAHPEPAEPGGATYGRPRID